MKSQPSKQILKKTISHFFQVRSKRSLLFQVQVLDINNLLCLEFIRTRNGSILCCIRNYTKIFWGKRDVWWCINLEFIRDNTKRQQKGGLSIHIWNSKIDCEFVSLSFFFFNWINLFLMELALTPIFYLQSLRSITIKVTYKICCLKSTVKHQISTAK